MWFKKSKIHSNPQDMALRLIEVGKIDTVYNDVYLHRARKIMNQVLSYDAYRQLIENRDLIPHLTKKIRTAMNGNDWAEVKQLSERISTLKKNLEKNLSLFDLGQRIYDSYEIVPDPFSPGLQNLIGISLDGLSDLRDEVLKKLTTLESDDSEWQSFYSARRRAYRNISFDSRALDGLGMREVIDDSLHHQAILALNSADMDLLEHVADSLMELDRKKKLTNNTDSSETSSESIRQDRLYPFSQETLTNATHLGLTAARANAEPQYSAICHRYAWHPVYIEDVAPQGGKTHKKEIHFTEEIPEPMQERIEHYVMHPFINSGGSRHLPDMVNEDFLVEDFPDPAEDDETPATELLAALGLKKRRGLSRIQIENVLLEHGCRVVAELGLEPEAFRLVCIPSDLHIRLGKARGWGNQKVWTHFDGYKMLKGGKLMAMAGGDVRFGGVYDLVTIGREYESDHVIVRFAVVQRKRMMAW